MSPRLVVVTLAILALAACDGQRLTGTPLIAGTSNAAVRLVNASASVSAFDLAIGGSVGTGDGGIGFGSATECRPVTPGSLVGIRVAGSANDLPGFDAPAFENDERATVLVTGPADSLRFTTLFDDGNVPAAGRARLRVFNASATGDVDVRIGIGAAATTLISRLGRNAVSGFIDLPAGANEITFVDSSTGSTLVGPQAFTLVSGQSRTIVLGDPASGGTPLRTFEFGACP
jgi:hypothetical protein